MAGWNEGFYSSTGLTKKMDIVEEKMGKNRKGLWIYLLIIMSVMVLALGCSTSSDDDDDDDNSGSSSGTYSQTFPKNLAVTSPTAASSSQLAASQNKTLEASSGIGSSDYDSKIAALNAVLNATDIASCADAVPEFFDNSNEFTPCYGPEMTVSGMSDDADNQNIGRAELGMYWEYSQPGGTSGQSCSSAKVNSLFEVSSRNMDYALGLHAMVVCAANLSGSSMPAVGESVSVTSALSSVDLASLGITVTAASVERLADYSPDTTTDTYAVYKTSVTGSLPLGTQPTTTPTNQFAVTVKNIPLNADNTDNKGVLSFILYEVEDSAYSFTKHQVSSLSWERVRGGLKYLYRKGEFVEDDANTAATMLDDDGMTVLTSASPGSEPNTCTGAGWCNAYSLILADFDSNMFGKVGYARFIGDDSSESGTFNVVTDATTRTGQAYFGNAAADILTTNEQAVFDITGINCVPRQSSTHQDILQKQSITLDSASGEWIPDTSETAHITYVPTDTCTWDASADSGATFQVIQDSYDATLDYPVVNDLYGLTDYQGEWTTPNLPVIDY